MVEKLQDVRLEIDTSVDRQVGEVLLKVQLLMKECSACFDSAADSSLSRLLMPVLDKFHLLQEHVLQIEEKLAILCAAV